MDQVCQLVPQVGQDILGREDAKLVNVPRSGGQLIFVSSAPSWLTCGQLHLHYRDDNITKPRVPPHVVYAHLKFLWSSKKHDESLKFLLRFTHGLAKDVVPEIDLSIPGNKQKLDELSRLLARCYFKQGQWQVALHNEWDTVSFLPMARYPI